MKNNAKKKTSLYKERDEVARQQFLEEIKDIPVEDHIYIDESGVDKFLQQEHGWSKIGVPIIGEVSGKRYTRESFVAAKVKDRVIAPFCYKGTCNTKLFNLWLENLLIPLLTPGKIVIMDNATFHKSPKTKELIENAGCTLKFLPPYSPDLNPIEVFWANFKASLRK